MAIQVNGYVAAVIDHESRLTGTYGFFTDEREAQRVAEWYVVKHRIQRQSMKYSPVTLAAWRDVPDRPTSFDGTDL